MSPEILLGAATQNLSPYDIECIPFKFMPVYISCNFWLLISYIHMILSAVTTTYIPLL